LTTKLPYIGLIILGVCSGLYHALLKYHAQWGPSTPPPHVGPFVDKIL